MSTCLAMLAAAFVASAQAHQVGDSIDPMARCIVEAQIGLGREKNHPDWDATKAHLEDRCAMEASGGRWSNDSVADGWRHRRWIPKDSAWSFSQMAGTERNGSALLRSVLRFDSTERLDETEFDRTFRFLDSDTGRWNLSKTFHSRIFECDDPRIVVVGSIHGAPELRIDVRASPKPDVPAGGIRSPE